MKDSFRKICPACGAPNFYFREYCIMCDAALDRSGRTRPDPKVHDEGEVVPEDLRMSHGGVPKEKPSSSIIQALLRVELGRKKIQDLTGEQLPHVRPKQILGLGIFLLFVIASFFISPTAGLLMLAAFFLFLILPLQDIRSLLTRHRIVFWILSLVLLAAWGADLFVPKQRLENWWRHSAGRKILLQGKQFLLKNMPANFSETGSLEGPFYFAQEFKWPGTEKVKYLWPMENHERCEEFLNRDTGHRVAGAKPVESCLPDQGQYSAFFRFKPQADWYVVFESPGKPSNIAIFEQNKYMRELETKNMFQNVWLFVKSVQALMEKENPPVVLTARIIAPQGEVNDVTGQLK